MQNKMPHALIVDDHPLYREGLIGALRARLGGFSVSGAGTAEEGLALLEAHPDIELVLIDLRLPGMDGFAALRLYGERFPAVARVVVSGSDDAALVQRAFAAGASGFIPKSLAVEAVAAAIRRVMQGELYVPQIGEPVAAAAASPASLTLRQLEVLRLLGEGYTNKEIARALDITERTAKAHIAAIFAALNADNRTQAVLAAQRAGWIGTPGAAA
jgi:two-component system nitrate/nitrite response regulator NarL